MSIETSAPQGSSAQPTLLRGTPVVPGVAYAPVVVATTAIAQSAIDAFDHEALDEQAALARFDEAVVVVAERLAVRASKVSGSAAEVLTATAGLARDKGLRSAVAKRVKAGEPLLVALHGGVDQFADLFAQMGGLMAERVTDLRDIEKRVTASLVGEPEPGVPTPEEPSVLVAEDLAPADTAGLDAARVVALVTEKGGPTSHTAIIARQLGIPCVVAAAGAMGLRSGAKVLVDGTTGEIEVAPDEASARARVEAAAVARAALESWTGPARTSDGTRVKILANVADGASARAAADGPVEGVGLFRTELCFLNRKDEPTVAEAADFAARVRARGLVPGVMIEVPSAALHADRLLEHVDFLSIGTNDLSQYTLAADRLSADLADLTDPWQPALLLLVHMTAAAGQRAGKPVGVCGEAAADPLLACVLVGLGITSLSCAASAVAGVGSKLGAVTLADCQRAAEAALAAPDPHAARAAAREVLTPDA